MILAVAEKYNVLGFDISHLEIQKLAYFLQNFGQTDLKLHYTKGTYGPYATNLKHLLAYLEGYYFKGQIRFQDLKPTDALQLVEERLPEVHNYLKENLSPLEYDRLEKVRVGGQHLDRDRAALDEPGVAACVLGPELAGMIGERARAEEVERIGPEPTGLLRDRA